MKFKIILLVFLLVTSSYAGIINIFSYVEPTIKTVSNKVLESIPEEFEKEIKENNNHYDFPEKSIVPESNNVNPPIQNYNELPMNSNSILPIPPVMNTTINSINPPLENKILPFPEVTTGNPPVNNFSESKSITPLPPGVLPRNTSQQQNVDNSVLPGHPFPSSDNSLSSGISYTGISNANATNYNDNFSNDWFNKLEDYENLQEIDFSKNDKYTPNQIMRECKGKNSCIKEMCITKKCFQSVWEMENSIIEKYGINDILSSCNGNTGCMLNKCNGSQECFAFSVNKHFYGQENDSEEKNKNGIEENNENIIENNIEKNQKENFSEIFNVTPEDAFEYCKESGTLTKGCIQSECQTDSCFFEGIEKINEKNNILDTKYDDINKMCNNSMLPMLCISEKCDNDSSCINKVNDKAKESKIENEENKDNAVKNCSVSDYWCIQQECQFDMTCINDASMEITKQQIEKESDHSQLENIAESCKEAGDNCIEFMCQTSECMESVKEILNDTKNLKNLKIDINELSKFALEECKVLFSPDKCIQNVCQMNNDCINSVKQELIALKSDEANNVLEKCFENSNPLECIKSECITESCINTNNDIINNIESSKIKEKTFIACKSEDDFSSCIENICNNEKCSNEMNKKIEKYQDELYNKALTQCKNSEYNSVSTCLMNTCEGLESCFNSVESIQKNEEFKSLIPNVNNGTYLNYNVDDSSLNIVKKDIIEPQKTNNRDIIKDNVKLFSIVGNENHKSQILTTFQFNQIIKNKNDENNFTQYHPSLEKNVNQREIIQLRYREMLNKNVK